MGTLVQSQVFEDSSGSNNFISGAFPSANTGGNAILVFGYQSDAPVPHGNNTITVQDSQGNVYTTIFGPKYNDPGDLSVMYAFIATNIKAGANTVTLHLFHSGSPITNVSKLAILEISGLAASPIDKNSYFGDSSFATNVLDSGGAGPTTQASEFLVGFGATLNNNETFTPGSGWTMPAGTAGQVTGGFEGAAIEWQSVSATGTYHAIMTQTGNDGWSAGIVTLKNFIAPPVTNIVHNVDCVVARPTIPLHFVDCIVSPFTWNRPVHSVDVWVSPVIKRQFVNLAMNLQFPIDPTQGYVKFAGTLATQQLSFVTLLGTIKVQSETFVSLAGTIQSTTRSYVKLAGSIVNHTLTQHNVDCVVSTSSLSYVQLNGTIRGAIGPGPCGSFPDASYVKLAAWIVKPNDSIQMPNSGFAPSEDWFSSQDALASYKAVSLFKLAAINLIVTAFTTGVISWQTRTRSWLRRVDAVPNGILLTTSVNTHTLPNGAVITTTTQVFQIQDTIKTVVTIQNSATPTRTSTIVTEETKSGQKSIRESETKNEQGVKVTTTKNVFSKPPTTENIQPLRVTTLDGVQHYQFFGIINTEWAGGDQEGTTTSSVTESIQGNTKTTDEIVDTPDGKHIETTTVITGSNEAGTTTTDTTENFVGLQTTVHKVVTFPNKQQIITDTLTTDLPSDSHSVETEVVTDEYGQVTTTVTDTETKTFQDPQTGLARTQITKKVTVTKGAVTTVDTTVQTTDDFENDIVNQKVQVFLIQEFTINCVIDELSMFALWEINETHQQNFALLELFGQQLSNATLSYAFRQNLIKQFNAANSCIKPVTLQANGRTYQVVFAPSASGFRAKFIPGTEPHVYELQLILQERSNLITGTQGFF